MHPQFQQALEDFALFNLSRNRSKSTISWYQDQLARFGHHLEQRGSRPDGINWPADRGY